MTLVYWLAGGLLSLGGGSSPVAGTQAYGHHLTKGDTGEDYTPWILQVQQDRMNCLNSQRKTYSLTSNFNFFFTIQNKFPYESFNKTIIQDRFSLFSVAVLPVEHPCDDVRRAGEDEGVGGHRDGGGEPVGLLQVRRFS